MSEIEWHVPFSPTIMETTVSTKFLDIVNKVGNTVLNDEEKSNKFDWSDKLVGKVHKEVSIPLEDEEKDYVNNEIKQACIIYFKKMVENGHKLLLYADNNQSFDITQKNINITQSWIVSQYRNEYNPWHTHSGDISAVIYLKIPKGMNDFIEKEMEDHFPSSGMIQFMTGEKQSFRKDTMNFKPEVGKFVIFPSWLKHSVYPFYVGGERRSMSFNARYLDAKQAKLLKRINK
tara:strand:- start:970 stop:1665 length:696 start_codon:yes stop_codon:yes gene_type:complete